MRYCPNCGSDGGYHFKVRLESTEMRGWEPSREVTGGDDIETIWESKIATCVDCGWRLKRSDIKEST